METAQPIDHVERIDWENFPVDETDPRDRLFADLSRGSSVRVIAIAEPVGADANDDAAHAAMRAFASAVAWSRETNPERLLSVGISAAHNAVCDLNADAGSNVRLRRFAGITAAVIAPGSLTVAIVPPGLAALLLPDREAVVLSGGDGLPLGSVGSIAPAYSRLTLQGDERLVLAWSSAETVIQPWLDAGGRDEQHLSDLAEASGAREVLVSVIDVAGVTDVLAAPRSWPGWEDDGGSPDDADELTAELLRIPRIRRAMVVDRWRNRAIEWAERHFADSVAEEAARGGFRHAARTTPTRQVSPYTSTGWRQIARATLPFMPRGVVIPAWLRVTSLLLLVVLVLGGIAYGIDGQRAQAERQGRAIGDARASIQTGLSAESVASAEEAFTAASLAIDQARRDGAPEAVVTQLGTELSAAMDARLGNRRLSDWQRLGTLPSSLANITPSLVMAGDELFMIANGVYKVSKDGQGISPSLRAGQVVDGLAVGNITCGTAAGDDLIAIDSSSAFRWSDGRWSALLLPPTPSGGTWSARACGTFDGNLYILDDRFGTVVKFVLRNFSEPPTFWVDDESLPAVGGATEMFIDGSIHLFREDGVLQTFHLGVATEQRQVAGRGELSPALATFSMDGGVTIYFAEVVNGVVQIRELQRNDGSEQIYSQPDPLHPNYDMAAVRALNGMADFAIDGGQGMIYFVGDGGLWVAKVPVNAA